MIERFVPRFLLIALLCWSGNVLAAQKNACAFDPSDIALTDIVQLYSCVPIADAICAKTCGGKAVSTAINTTIKNTHLAKTAIICQGREKEKTSHEINVNGLPEAIAVTCASIVK